LKKNWSIFAFIFILFFSTVSLSCAKNKKTAKLVEEAAGIESQNSSSETSNYDISAESISKEEEYVDGIDFDEKLPSTDDIALEEERIAKEISDLEDGLSDSKKPDEDEIQLKVITDKDDFLKFMEYGDELLIPQKIKDGYILVHSSSKKLERNTYDLNYRLTKKEIWDYTDYESAKLIETYSYYYLDNSFNLIKTILDSDQNQTVYNYGAEGLLASVRKFYCKDENKYLIFEKNIFYNGENKIKEEESKEYFYSEDYKKQIDNFSKKYKYFYNDEGIPPDFEYLENGVLKMKNKYSSEKGTYTSQTFFSADVSVKSYYENNFRIKDVYYNKDRVARVRNYEKNDISEF